MSTRIYCDQCGKETNEREALRFNLSGYSANHARMSLIGTIEIDICPECAKQYVEWVIGSIHIHRDIRDNLNPYQLQFTPTMGGQA